MICDIYLLYQLLNSCNKPILAEAWDFGSVDRIGKLISSLYNSEEEMKQFPCVILAECPTPPMHWEKRIIENALGCIKYGIPMFVCPSPVMGVSSPITVAGSVLTHTVEALSFLTFIELMSPGHPVLYGGIIEVMDMRSTYCTASAAESCLSTAAYSAMGHYYGLPTLSFLAQTDSKDVDYQAGFETSMNVLMSTLAGIDIVFGGGTLDSYLGTSTEKLVMDGELFQFANRINSGIQFEEDTLAKEEIEEVGWGEDGTFLELEHTAEWYRDEHCLVNEVISRVGYDQYKADNKTIMDRAASRISTTIENKIDPEAGAKLKAAMLDIANDLNVDISSFIAISDKA